MSYTPGFPGSCGGNAVDKVNFPPPPLRLGCVSHALYGVACPPRVSLCRESTTNRRLCSSGRWTSQRNLWAPTTRTPCRAECGWHARTQSKGCYGRRHNSCVPWSLPVSVYSVAITTPSPKLSTRCPPRCTGRFVRSVRCGEVSMVTGAENSL